MTCNNVLCCHYPRSVCVRTAPGNVNMVAYGKINSRLSPGVADYTPLAAKTRHLPPSPARDLAEWRVLAGNGRLHAIARQNMPIAAIVRHCPPKHTNNRRFHVLVYVHTCTHMCMRAYTCKCMHTNIHGSYL